VIGGSRGFAVVGSWECEEKAQTVVVYIANEEGRCIGIAFERLMYDHLGVDLRSQVFSTVIENHNLVK
jgi:hypothetical protein